MRLSKEELIDLILTGEYFVIQKKDDLNREDIRIKREDGGVAEVLNYPYRINQLPAYLFDELVRDGILRQDGVDEDGAAIFRVSTGVRECFTRAA